MQNPSSPINSAPLVLTISFIVFILIFVFLLVMTVIVSSRMASTSAITLSIPRTMWVSFLFTSIIFPALENTKKSFFYRKLLIFCCGSLTFPSGLPLSRSKFKPAPFSWPFFLFFADDRLGD